MTLEELLELSPDKLEAMSDKELSDFFAPYLKFTRPELVEKPTTKRTVIKNKANSIKKVEDLLSRFKDKFGDVEP